MALDKADVSPVEDVVEVVTVVVLLDVMVEVTAGGLVELSVVPSLEVVKVIIVVERKAMGDVSGSLETGAAGDVDDSAGGAVEAVGAEAAGIEADRDKTGRPTIGAAVTASSRRAKRRKRDFGCIFRAKMNGLLVRDRDEEMQTCLDVFYILIF